MGILPYRSYVGMCAAGCGFRRCFGLKVGVVLDKSVMMCHTMAYKRRFASATLKRV